MARSKTTTKKKQKVADGDERAEKITQVIPTPPPGEDEEKLSVSISTRVSWRLKIALLTMESMGQKTPKKKFVEQAILDALDRHDSQWGDANG